MIDVFNQVTAHKYGDILRSTHQLRYQAFVERMAYDIPIWSDMEYDKYDNLSTIYLVWRDEDLNVRGTCRIAPTDRDYMIKDVWPHIITKIPLPNSSSIWEASRFCVDHKLPSELRRQIISELVCACQQIANIKKIKYMIGVMPPNIWDRVFKKCGWDIQYIGPEIQLDTKEVIIAGKMKVSELILNNILNMTELKKLPIRNSKYLEGLLDVAINNNKTIIKEYAYA